MKYQNNQCGFLYNQCMRWGLELGRTIKCKGCGISSKSSAHPAKLWQWPQEWAPMKGQGPWCRPQSVSNPIMQTHAQTATWMRAYWWAKVCICVCICKWPKCNTYRECPACGVHWNKLEHDTFLMWSLTWTSRGTVWACASDPNGEYHAHKASREKGHSKGLRSHQLQFFQGVFPMDLSL